MTTGAQDYSILIEDHVAVLRGVLRLGAVEAYEAAFAPLRAQVLAAQEPYRIELGEVLFMNSSGIRALAGLVLSARDADKRLVIAGKKSVPWQSRTLSSLKSLDPSIELLLS